MKVIRLEGFVIKIISYKEVNFMSKAKLKKTLAGMLAATMVLGMGATAFAAESGDTPATSGGTSGAGNSEGHVEKEVQNVVLPTVPADQSPCAYTMDPERLIQETGGQKYEDYTFPAKDSDTGVYFLVADKEYSNTSNTLQVINKSSCNITLTVKVKATASAGGKDITLATGSTPSTSAAELYLGLKVGNDSQVVSATEAPVSKTIAGTPDNFETAVADGKYVYREKADATSWKAMNISMTGAVSNYKIEADTTAPTVDITWEWAKAAEDATVATDAVDYTEAPADVAPSIAVTDYDYDRTATFDIVTDFGKGNLAASSISSVKLGTDGITFETDLTSACIISGNTITFPSGKLGAAAVGTKRYVQVTFDNGTPITLTLTVTK